MIIFKKCKWRNFLSTGDNFTEVDLNRSKSTLIVGQNGAGKSTLLDAISFGLFGKPHRNINKPQLVNSINNKKCVVEVEFSIGNHNFKIIRGLKPQIFEIWQNDKMIDQSAAARDYQKFLELNILKLNHKSFHQIVVLGSSSFIPFMQLPTNQRRMVIEDLLDINIFSKMNILLKDSQFKTKECLKNTNYSLELVREKIDLQKNYVKKLAEVNDDSIQKVREKNKDLKKERKDVLKLIDVCNGNILEKNKDLKKELADLDLKRSKLISYKGQFTSKIQGISTETKFYEENDNCPTCTQSISSFLKEKKKSEAKGKARKLREGIVQVDSEVQGIDLDISTVQGDIDYIISQQHLIHVHNATIQRIDDSTSGNDKEIETLLKSTGDISAANAELESLRNDLGILTDKKLNLAVTQDYNTACAEMLKDTGIKTKIIKEYLPAMNTLINKYLQILDFFVQFNLDENFSETIRSRYRDAFNYASFSEGEKQRIDLALLFTWRMIAKMKNSAATNLLILDETFDSSLDHDGVDNLLKILDTLEDHNNIFIISHKGDILENKFRSKITFKKEHNFSVMEKV